MHYERLGFHSFAAFFLPYLWLLLLALGALAGLAGILVVAAPSGSPVLPILLAAGGVLALAAAALAAAAARMEYMAYRITLDAQALRVRSGLVAVREDRIPYAEMESAAAARGAVTITASGRTLRLPALGRRRAESLAAELDSRIRRARQDGRGQHENMIK